MMSMRIPFRFDSGIFIGLGRVYTIVNKLKRIEKIPFEVIQLIKSNSDPTYKPEISKEIPIEDQNLREDTYSILGWIASKYWGEDILEEVNKVENQKIEDKNEIAVTLDERAAVYNDIEPETLDGSNLPIVVPEIKWYQKLKDKVISFLRTVFRMKRSDINEEVN